MHGPVYIKKESRIFVDKYKLWTEYFKFFFQIYVNVLLLGT